MVSTAVSGRRRHKAHNTASSQSRGPAGSTPRSTPRSTARRPLTVAISAIATIVLFAGYCAADIADVIAGPLTLQPVSKTTFAQPPTAKAGGTIAKSLDLNKPIDATAAAKLMDELLSAQGVGSDTSVIIEDAQGNVAAEHEADTTREPASTMKTLTALAAASTLNMASTLDTQVFLSSSGSASGTLTLKGNGDMLLSAGQSDPDHINGRAGLSTLAQATVAALAQRGITSVTLNYDDTLFGDSRVPTGLSQGGNTVAAGYTNYFTPVSSMAIDGGRQYSADSPVPDDPDDAAGYPELSQHTAEDTANTFAKLLEAQGLTVDSAPSEQEAPGNTEPIASVSSATLSEIMAFTLRRSDNTLAEEFGRLLALHVGSENNSPEGAVKTVRAIIGKLGIDATGLTMADCSGLSPGSKLTVRTLAEVQRHNLTANGGAAAAEGLSIAGLAGTAQDRYTDENVAGLLRVKTGSLDNVTSMTGNVSRLNGGALSFAVVVNDPDDYEAARNAINEFITKLAGL